MFLKFNPISEAQNDNFDIIIHAAMCSGTGRYGKPDGLEVMYKNIRMFELLIW